MYVYLSVTHSHLSLCTFLLLFYYQCFKIGASRIVNISFLHVCANALLDAGFGGGGRWTWTLANEHEKGIGRQWRINDFPEVVGANSPCGGGVGAPKYDFAKFSQKTAWIWKNLDPGEGAQTKHIVALSRVFYWSLSAWQVKVISRSTLNSLSVEVISSRKCGDMCPT